MYKRLSVQIRSHILQPTRDKTKRLIKVALDRSQDLTPFLKKEEISTVRRDPTPVSARHSVRLAVSNMTPSAILLVSLAATGLVLLAAPGACGLYEPTWESLDARPLPEWYDECKFGVFIHMGVFSVPALTEWFWYRWKGNQRPDIVAYMKDNFRPGFSYPEFAPDYRLRLFDANQWVELFKDAGAKYIVFTTKHHEGYTNWPSSVKWNWNSVDVGPHRDVVGELTAAIRNNSDLRLGLYHSLVEWYHPLLLEDMANGFTTQKFPQAVNMPEKKDIVMRYKPDIVWGDGTFHGNDVYWNSTHFLAWLYNESPVKDHVVVNDRWGNNTGCRHGGFYDCADGFSPGSLQKHKWESSFPIDPKSWGYRQDATIDELHDTPYLIQHLVKTVSCGGNFLVNVGPTADGVITAIFQTRLRDIGAWLKVNGEAIYATKPWSHQNDTVSGNVWYTSKKSTNGTVVYGTALIWPKGGKMILGAAQATSNTVVSLLGYAGKFSWTKNPSGGIVVDIPAIPMDQMPCQWAWTFKLENLM